MTWITVEDELQLTLEFMTLDAFKDEHWVQQTRSDGNDSSGIAPTDEKSCAERVCDGSCEVASQLDSSEHVILLQDSWEDFRRSVNIRVEEVRQCWASLWDPWLGISTWWRKNSIKNVYITYKYVLRKWLPRNISMKRKRNIPWVLQTF